MRYRSTRGGIAGYSFEQAIFSGIASDGGLLMPEHIPHLTENTLSQWSKLSYRDIVKEVAAVFIEDEISRSDLSELVDKAFQSFSSPDIIKLTKHQNSLQLLELYHGPTLSFKDLGLRCIGQVMNHFLQKRNKHVTAIVATSGDTGSAAISAVKGLSSIDIIVLLPKGLITKVQELMMTTVIDNNVHNFRGEACSDEFDELVRQIFEDTTLVEQNSLCCMNSFNWARITFQMSHFFWLYFQTSHDLTSTVEVVIPTGGSGNVVAAVIAQKMGLPIRIVSSVNKNDAFAHAIETGELSTEKSTKPSIAPAMDIMVPYNFERLVDIFCDGDTKLVSQFMDDISKHKRAPIPLTVYEKIRSAIVSSYTADDDIIRETVKRCWEENKYHICPHTATAVAYHYDQEIRKPNEVQRVCVATASPGKFEDVYSSIGIPPFESFEVQQLFNKPENCHDLIQGQNWLQIIKNTIIKCSR